MLSDHKAVHVGGTAIVKYRFHILVAGVGADHAALGEAEHVTRLSVDDVAYVDGPFFGEEHFLDFFELLVNNSPGLLKPWLKIHEQANHEVSV